MKSTFTTLSLVVLLSSASFAQSNSYLALKKKFKHADEVHSIKVGSFVLRTVLMLSDEEDWADDFGKIRSVRIINIPKREFSERDVTVNGFKKVLAKDNFDELVTAIEGGEQMTIFQQKGKENDLYFLLVEDKTEVTAIEIRGVIYPEKIIKDYRKQFVKNT